MIAGIVTGMCLGVFFLATLISQKQRVPFGCAVEMVVRRILRI